MVIDINVNIDKRIEKFRENFLRHVSIKSKAHAKLLNDALNSDNDKKIKNIIKQLDLESEDTLEFLGYYVVETYLEETIRKLHATEEYLKFGDKNTADHWEHILKKIAENEVPEEKIKEAWDQNAIALPVYTMHPTDSISTEFILGPLAKFIYLLENNQPLDDFFKELFASPMNISGPKKTQSKEMDETIYVLDRTYALSLEVRENLIEALGKYPKYKPHIDINKQLIKPCVWATGDGDGNSNATAESLKEGSDKLKARIKELYKKDLQDVLLLIPDSDELKKVIDDLQDYDSPEQLIKALKPFLAYDAVKENITRIIYKINSFGFHYAKIDIRHNSTDIMKTLAHVAKLSGLIEDEEDFLANPDNYKKDISIWLKLQNLNSIDIDKIDVTSKKLYEKLKSLQKDSSFINQIKNSNLEDLEKNILPELDLGELENYKGEVISWLKLQKLASVDTASFTNSIAKNIFERLKIIGKDSSISDKFIIAETNSPENVFASMILLKATSSKIADRDSMIDIVTLSESVNDLESLPKLLESLLKNEIYRKHLESRGRQIPMFAQSDTMRRNGSGSKYIVNKIIGTVYKLFAIAKENYAELKNISIEIFNGGGAALQRGGGKIVEFAHILGIIARSNEINIFGPPHMTIQNHQGRSLVLTAANFIALAGQSFYARLQTEKNKDGKEYITPREAELDPIKVKIAAENYSKMSEIMLKKYAFYMGNPDKPEKYNVFNKLFENGPWISVFAGNVSSRPSGRENFASEGKNKVSDLKGKDPKLLGYRAITVEKMAAHTRTQIINLIATLEGFQYLTTEELQETKNNNKPFRDFVRNTATSLHMVDFDDAWLTLAGRDKRPDKAELETLANKFDLSKGHEALMNNYPDKIITGVEFSEIREITLAWFELYTYEIAKKCCEATRIDYDQNITLKTPLEKAFPKIAKNLSERDKPNRLGRALEAFITNMFNKNPNMEVTPTMEKIVKIIYIPAESHAPWSMVDLERTSATLKSKKEMIREKLGLNQKSGILI